MTKKHIILLLTTLFVSVAALQAQIYDEQGQYVDTTFHDHINRSADDFVKVSLVVAEPGGALYSIFGHACLHMVCDTFGLDYVYSYESEDASSKFFKFLAGRLNMGLFAIPFDEYVADYAAEGREIVEYPLLLSPQAKQELWRVLDEHVDKGIYLPYDYCERGCTYSCLQFVNMAIAPKSISYAPWSERILKSNRREIGYEFAHKDFPWNSWLMTIIIGADFDKQLSPEKRLIIPSELVNAWSTATIDDQPVLGKAHMVSPSNHPSYATWFTPWLVALTLLLLVVLGWYYKMDWADYIVLSISTLLGLFVCYLVIVSKLPCTNWNWLIIPFNLLPAVAWKWRKYWGVYYAGLIIIWIIAMAILPHRQVDPANSILALTFATVLAKQWWQLNKNK